MSKIVSAFIFLCTMQICCAEVLSYSYDYAGGCISRRSISPTALMSLDSENELSVNIYPVPVESELNVVVDFDEMTENHDLKYQIVSVSGNVILTGEILQHHTTINVTNIHEKLFVLNIFYNSQVYSYSIIKK